MRKRDDSKIHIIRANAHRLTDISAVGEELRLSKSHGSRRARGSGSNFQEIGSWAFPANRGTIKALDLSRLKESLCLSQLEDPVELGRLKIPFDWGDDHRSIPARHEECRPTGFITDCRYETVAGRKRG